MVSTLIISPLGELITYAQTEELDTRQKKPPEAGVLPSGAVWTRWLTSSATVEVFVGHYTPVLPPHMHVEGCKAVVWRLRASQATAQVVLSCELSALPLGADGGPDSGEGLEAYTWFCDGKVLSLGTEDGEFLARRASKGYLLPPRLVPDLVQAVRYSDTGLHVAVPALEAGEQVEIHFVVAWATAGDPDACDTWFAVDQHCHEVCRRLGIPNGHDD